MYISMYQMLYSHVRYDVCNLCSATVKTLFKNILLHGECWVASGVRGLGRDEQEQSYKNIGIKHGSQEGQGANRSSRVL